MDNSFRVAKGNDGPEYADILLLLLKPLRFGNLSFKDKLKLLSFEFVE